MQLIIFLGLLGATLYLIHTVLPRLLARTGYIGPARILIDLIFLQIMMFTVLMCLKSDALGTVNYLELFMNKEFSALAMNLFYSYLMLLLYCLPVFVVMYGMYRIYYFIKGYHFEDNQNELM